MIKATGVDGSGRRVLVLGLSFKNLDRLRAGEPILFDGTPYGYLGNIAIFAGKTESVMEQMITASNPDVVIREEKGSP